MRLGTGPNANMTLDRSHPLSDGIDNCRSHFGESPDLAQANTEAVSNSMDGHYNLSLRALGEKTKMAALLNMLSELVYEELQTLSD